MTKLQLFENRVAETLSYHKLKTGSTDTVQKKVTNSTIYLPEMAATQPTQAKGPSQTSAPYKRSCATIQH